MSYSVDEFERYVRKVEAQLGRLPFLAIQKLASAILGRIANDPRLAGSQVRGPAGRVVAYQTGEATELGQAAARAVLELSPGVKFVEIRPKFKQVLKFDWRDAPPGAIGESQRRYPYTVFFTRVRVPYRVGPNADEVQAEGRQAFTSADFREWLTQQIGRRLISGSQFTPPEG